MLYLWYHKNNGVMLFSHQVMLIIYIPNTADIIFVKNIFLFHTFSVSMSFWDLVILLHVNLVHYFWLFYCISSYACNIFYVRADVVMHSYAPTSIGYKEHSERNLHVYFLVDPWGKQVMVYSCLLTKASTLYIIICSLCFISSSCLLFWISCELLLYIRVFSV